MTDRTGLLDCYQLIRKLGSGTFGQVYLAKDRHRNKDVAIKVLPSLVNEDLPRFLTEARIMMRLKHSHIVQILDFGIDVEKQTPFLVMEYATNGPLRQRHPKGSRVPLLTILSYITQLAAALQVAHDDQIIHRDIKPENMLLNQPDQLLLSDFGIATMVPSSALHSAQTFGGTIPYMAPEQTEGHPCPASDQYSLAVVVYEWVCGQRPFHGSIFEIAIQHRLNLPPSLCELNPMISPEVEQVIFKALAKDPVERFASIEIFAQALEAACSEHCPQILMSSEAQPLEPSSGSSKTLIPDKEANSPPSISGDNAVVLDARAVADPVKQSTQQPAMLTTPFPQNNSQLSGETSDVTLSSTPDAPDLAIRTEIGAIELLPSLQLIDSRPTALLSDVSSTGMIEADLSNKNIQKPVMADMSSVSINDDRDALSPEPANGTKSEIIELPSSQQRNTGKTAATTIVAFAPSSYGSSANRSPMQAGKARQTGTRRKKRGLVGLVIAILVATLLLLCSGVASFASGLQLFQFGLPLVSNAAPPATITITPDSKLEQDSYVIQAIAGNPDPTQRQVSLRQLTFSPPSQSKSVTATGVGHVPAQAATGQLTFYNGSNQAFMVSSTTAIPGPNGVSVETDGPADVPAAHPPTEGTITVDAHATTTGANGNMAAGAINETCCVSGSFIMVVSSAFTGGQDEQDYTYLQQNDVDGYVNQIKLTLSQQALNGLKSQLKPNEQLAGDPQCTMQSSQDQPIGDQGQNVSSANVTVSATCTGLAYDVSGVQALAQNLLKRKVVNDLGQAYALAGTIVTRQIVTDINDSVVTLQVAVAGTWYYRFDDRQKQTLANQLANKTRVTAQGFLNTYKGIAKASINIANGGGSLPNNPQQIGIVLVAVSGVSTANLPPLLAVEPTTSPVSTSKSRG